jgi:phage-related protein (TIGR01555 family)
MAGVLSRIADAFRAPEADIAPASPMPMRDAVYNPMSGMGMSNDASVHTRYYHRRLGQHEIEQAYSGSWLMRKLIDKPAKDQVRPRRQWKADKAAIALLEKEEKRLDVWGKHKDAEIERGLGGGAIIIWVKGDDPTTPLDPTRIAKGAITSLSVWKRWHLRLGDKIFNLESEWHGQPEFFEVTSLNMVTQAFGVTSSAVLRLHPSRVIVYRGEHVANDNGCSWEDAFWGASKVEIALQAVLNADTSQQSFSGMIKDAVNVIIGIPNLTTTYKSRAEIEAYQTARMTAVNAARSMWRAIVKDNGSDGSNGAETVEYRQMVWNGIPQALMGFVSLVAAAGNMPVTELVGTSATGLNATGEGDRTSWYDELGTRRDTEGKPCLEKLDVALIPSAIGRVDDGIWWEYGAFDQPTELEQAQAMFARAQARQIYLNSGMLNSLAAEQSLANTVVEEAILVGYDDSLADIPEDEKYPSLSAPETDAAGNPIDPSALQGGGDPVLRALGGEDGSQPARRRAANDALIAAGMDEAARTAVLDAAFGGDA